MENTEFTRITIETSGRKKIAVEFPSEDVTVEELCQAFRTIMVGLTFSDKTAGDMLADYLEEYYGDVYNIVNIN